MTDAELAAQAEAVPDVEKSVDDEGNLTFTIQEADR